MEWELTYEKMELSPTTLTIPFSAAHSKSKSSSQHHFMTIIVIKRKYFYEGRTLPSSWTVTCVLGTFANSDFTLSVNAYRERSQLGALSWPCPSIHTVGVSMFAGSSISWVIKKRSVNLSHRSRGDDWYRSGKVLSFCIDDPGIPLLRTLDWLERQLLWNIILISGFIRRGRSCLQGEFILGKMSGHGYDEQ